jgi:hypothetical protein
MIIVKVVFSEKIRWLIHKDDPATYNLQSFSPWLFLNPLSYPKIPSRFGTNLDSGVTAAIEDSVLVEMNAMIFVYPGAAIDNDLNVDEFNKYHVAFLTNLRHASKQAELSRAQSSIVSVETTTEEAKMLELMIPSFPHGFQNSENFFLRKYLIDTAITWKHLETADRTMVNNNLPVFSTLLLDAIHAFMEGDYRRAILYSAISAETVARIKLDEVYNALLEEGDAGGTLRIVSSQKGRNVVVEDPIYKYLSDKHDFRLLLHERPLYVLRRSLLIDQQALYQNAMKLHNTRNQIAHQGEIPIGGETSYFGITKPDAQAAIECAIDLFKWFGVTDEYIIPTDKLINPTDFVEVSPSDLLKKFKFLQ